MEIFSWGGVKSGENHTTRKIVIQIFIIREPEYSLIVGCAHMRAENTSSSKIPDQDGAGSGLRQDIAARNPYALAEVIYARTEQCPLVWIEKDIDFNRALLQDILHCSYDRLFDPVYGVSPLFPSPVYRTIGIVPEVARLTDTRYSAERIDSVRQSLRRVLPKGLVQPPQVLKTAVVPETAEAPKDNTSGEPHNTAAVQAEASPCSAVGNKWGFYMVSATSRGYYCRKATGTKAEVIHDLMQGCTKSCYIIAALASNAWHKYPNFPLNIDMTNGGVLKDSYDFTFHDRPPNGVNPVSIGGDLVKDTGGNLVFCRPSDSREVWTGIYEKALGVFLGLAASDLPAEAGIPAKRRPHLPALSGGNPLTILHHLTAAAVTTYQTNYLQKPSFGRITTKITWKDATQGAASVPMAAWTFISSAAAKAAHGQNITYGQEILVANHSYSILGAVKNNNINYIVLRNPYGKLWGADPTDPVLALYTGAWAPTADFSRTLSVDDGIFALPADRFELYFQGFGWVG